MPVKVCTQRTQQTTLARNGKKAPGGGQSHPFLPPCPPAGCPVEAQPVTRIKYLQLYVNKSPSRHWEHVPQWPQSELTVAMTRHANMFLQACSPHYTDGETEEPWERG